MKGKCIIRVHNKPEPIGAGYKSLDYADGLDSLVDPSDMRRIPPLWMALFAEEDLKFVNVPESFLEEGAPAVTIPALHTTKTSALERFDSRKASILTHVDPAIWLYVELFRNAVAACEYDNVEIDFYGLWRLCGKSADKVGDYIHYHLHTFELDESWPVIYGDKTIADTSALYGLVAYDGVNPFESGIDLPWVTLGETYSSGKLRRNVLPIDDKFVLTYDASGETALQFAICFKLVWDGIKQETKKILLNHWKDVEYVTIRGAKESGPAQRVFSPGRPVLGLLTGIPETLDLSFAVDNGRGLIWNARTVRSMSDDVLVAFIAELIVRTRLQIDLLSNESIRISTQTEAGMDVDPLMKWIQDNRPYARRCIIS